MIDAFRGLAITSLDLSVEEGLELIVENNAKVLGKDVVIVAMTDYDTEGIGGADTLNYVAFFLTDLGLVSHFSFISGGVNLLRVTHRWLDKLPEMEEYNHVVLRFKLLDKVRVNCWSLVSDFVEEDANTFDLPQLFRATWSIQHQLPT